MRPLSALATLLRVGGKKNAAPSRPTACQKTTNIDSRVDLLIRLDLSPFPLYLLFSLKRTLVFLPGLHFISLQLHPHPLTFSLLDPSCHFPRPVSLLNSPPSLPVSFWKVHQGEVDQDYPEGLPLIGLNYVGWLGIIFRL